MLRYTRFLDMIAHAFGWGDVNVFVHLLTGSMLRSTRLLDMITQSFGWGGVNVLVPLLTWYILQTSCMLCSTCFLYMVVHTSSIIHATLWLRSTCFLYTAVHTASIFHATLHMSSFHDGTYCKHLSCYAPHVFTPDVFCTWLYIPLTSFMPPSRCRLYMFVHAAPIFHATYAPDVLFTMFVHAAPIFHATLHIPAVHDGTYC